MIECAIIGDSIAVGVSRFRPECHTNAVVGISSSTYVSRFRNVAQADRVLISLGSNDSTDARTEPALRELRSRIGPGSVTWLLSANNRRTADIAMRIALENGDGIIDVRTVVGSDGVHPNPAGYRRLAQEWRN